MSGILISKIPVYSTGGQTPPAKILSSERGAVTFLSKGDEPFMADFQLREGQVRGRAYNTEGTATFHLLEGAVLFVGTDAEGGNPQVKLIRPPTTIVVPAHQTHTFIPLTDDGRILETVDLPTSKFSLGSLTVKIFGKMAPLMKQIQQDLRNGEYGLEFSEVALKL